MTRSVLGVITQYFALLQIANKKVKTMYEIKNIDQVEKIMQENNVKIKDNWMFHNFWRKVDIKDNIDDCWNWLAYKNDKGYGLVGHERSHRVSYILTKGLFPYRLQVQHLCNNTSCCNPNHLILGKGSDNSRYMVKCGRWNNYGENNGLSILTNDQIREILKTFADELKLHPGFKQWQIIKPIAKKFEITEGHVNKIINGKRRKNIYDEFNQKEK